MTFYTGQVGILGLGAYAPERSMSNEEWADYVDTSDEWITSRTGIKSRRIAAPHESTADLAVHAGRRALESSGLRPRDLDEVIVATDTPEVYIPDTASFVQHRLGLRQVPAYDLGGSGCAGFVQALDIACSRVRCGQSRVLVLGVEVLSRLMDWTDRGTCVLFGDGAGAAIVGKMEGGKRETCLPAEILAVVAGTDGSRTDILTLETGGTRKPFTEERARQGLHQHIFMQGREVFKQAVHRMSSAGLEVLAKAGRDLSDVSLLVPHQANLRIIKAVAKALDVSLEKVFVNVEEYGNTGSASVPLALSQALAGGRIHPGDLVLATTFGAGFHWSAALLRF